MDLIKCFNDTMGLATEGKLRHKTRKAQKSVRVYKEGFTAKKHKKFYSKADIIVEIPALLRLQNTLSMAGLRFSISQIRCIRGAE